MKKETISQITSIQLAGFSKVKWYDEDMEYVYYDALLNDIKVEVRIKKNVLEWRYLGTSIKEIEWYSITNPTEIEDNLHKTLKIDELNFEVFEAECSEESLKENSETQLSLDIDLLFPVGSEGM